MLSKNQHGQHDSGEKQRHRRESEKDESVSENQDIIPHLSSLQHFLRTQNPANQVQQKTILQLQRLYGNTLTQQLIQRNTPSGNTLPTPTPSGGTPETETTEPPEIKARLDMIEKEYRKMVTQGRLKGYGVAADNMKHFLDGGGTPRTLDSKWLRGFPAVLKSERTNQQRFESESKTKSFDHVAPTLQDGQTITIIDHWDRLVEPSQFDKSQWKLYYASGTSTLTSKGEFTLTRNGNTITVTGTVVHSWRDDYDWHEDLEVELPNGEMATDADALLLEQYRGAAPYKMDSTWTQQVNGTYTIIDILPDQSEYIWTGP